MAKQVSTARVRDLDSEPLGLTLTFGLTDKDVYNSVSSKLLLGQPARK